MPAKSLGAASIWKTLSKINVNEFTEEKGGLTYLSWSHAYRIMMENYPEMTIKWHGTTDEHGVTRDATYYEGGTTMVSCSVTIGDVVREMWLPVMDYRMKSIAHPSSRDISDAKMRCLTKCFSLHGLANYIYSGDGLPTEEATASVAEVAPPKVKAKRAKRTKKAKKPVVESPDAGALKNELIALTHRLNDGGWTPDDATKAQIKAAVTNLDAEALTSLVKALQEVEQPLLLLNDNPEEND